MLLSNTKILLAVCGGIAAYKAPALVRALQKQGATVRVVLTQSATHFVSTLALQSVSQHRVGTDLFDPAFENEIGHIELARWPDAILVAPATANSIAKIALGLCDDLLTTLVSATTAPVVVAPAMNTQMLLKPATQGHIETLRAQTQFSIVEPDSGALACQEVGPGRLPDPPVLIQALLRATSQPLLHNTHVVITAGPTREPIDPVRFITNHSSGKMGYAIAAAASALSARVTLVSGPTNLSPPPGVTHVPIQSAADMCDAVFQNLPADIVVKAAAVADWTPSNAADHKIKKTPGEMSIPMKRTRDILASLGQLPDDQRPFLIGFAAETQNLEQYALEKLRRKRANMLVANNVLGPSSAFGSDSSSILLFDNQGHRKPIGPAPKTTLAFHILQHAARLLNTQPTS